MKTNKTIAYGLFAVIIALALAGCPDPDPTHTHDYGTEWKSNAAQHWHECSCGDKTDVADHTAGDWIVDQAATATTDGSRHKECTVCGYVTETETIPATGEGHVHDYSAEWSKNETQHWHECSCGDKTDVADHTAGDWIVDQAATATTDGSKHKECTFCGYVTETETIPATGEGHTHDYSAEWSKNETQHWHECSCGEKADIANHSGDPCDICGYASGTQNPDICECNGIAEDCECEDCDCEVCEEEPPVNQPPTANAGTDKTVTLAGNLTITLSGTGADSDGNITAYAWECVSYTANQGAVSAAYTKAQVDALIANANTATATVAPRKAGTYVFKLTVTDNDGGSDTDTVTVVVEGYTVTTTLNIDANNFTVSTEIDFAPSYNSVSNTIDFSTSNINSILTYTLTVVNHDGSYTNTWNSADGFDGKIAVANNYEGSFEFNTFTQTFWYNGQSVGSPRVLKVIAENGKFEYFGDDYSGYGNVPAINGVSISRKVNEIPPVSAHAQAAPTHTLANNLSITLNGTDSIGNISAYAWECASYTANQGAVSSAYTTAEVDALIANAGTATATVAPRKAGTYVFKLTVTGDEGESDTDTVAVVVEGYTVSANVNVAAVPFTDGTELKFEVDSNNYSFVGGTPNGFMANDLNGITYTLSSVNPVKDLSAYSNGNIPSSVYDDLDYPTITQTFNYNGQAVGSRKIVVEIDPVGFSYLYEYNPTELNGVLYDCDFVPIYAIPATTLNLSKEITEL
jgi:Fe-S cluster assembly iron-binding protein IscA